MSARRWAKAVMPIGVLDWWRRRSGRVLRFHGCPADWTDALRQSDGYEGSHILDRVRTATRDVIAGKAAFERDSVLFHESELPFAVLSALLRAAVKAGGVLDVVDVGGSLGSTYRQCGKFLDVVSRVSWQIVEQANFVDAGRAEFGTPELSFHESLRDLPPGSDRVGLLLSVLQYLPNPEVMLTQISTAGVTTLVIDRTPLSDSLDEDRLCIQRVPSHIYAASYPCWIFSRRRLLKSLEPAWRIVSEFHCADGAGRTDDGVSFEFRGLILERRT